MILWKKWFISYDFSSCALTNKVTNLSIWLFFKFQLFFIANRKSVRVCSLFFSLLYSDVHLALLMLLLFWFDYGPLVTPDSVIVLWLRAVNDFDSIERVIQFQLIGKPKLVVVYSTLIAIQQQQQSNESHRIHSH